MILLFNKELCHLADYDKKNCVRKFYEVEFDYPPHIPSILLNYSLSIGRTLHLWKGSYNFTLSLIQEGLGIPASYALKL